MNKVLIDNWNSRVQKDDLVIFLGDFIFKTQPRDLPPSYFIDMLNGHIAFIRGNHDNNNSLDTKIHSLIVEMAGKEIFCVHDPAHYSSSYSINLVGHIHEYWKVDKIYHTFLVNVGVDVWKFAPVDINEILKAIKDFEGEKKRNIRT